MRTPGPAAAVRRGVRAAMIVAALPAALALILAAVPAAPLAAQGLSQIERLAMDGQTERARELLSEWWEAGYAESGRADRQFGLWLRGLLTVDPEMAALDFQRLMVEYPGTRFAARAIMRLARAAEARGRTEEAADYFRRLVRSYPGSTEEQQARGWLEDRGLPLETLDRAAPAPGPAADSMSEGAPSGTPEGSEGRWAVQFGAFSTQDRALTLLKEMRELGHEVRMVRVSGSPLFRIRMGRFNTEEAAMREMSRLRDAGLEVTVVSNADRESS